MRYTPTLDTPFALTYREWFAQGNRYLDTMSVEALREFADTALALVNTGQYDRNSVADLRMFAEACATRVLNRGHGQVTNETRASWLDFLTGESGLTDLTELHDRESDGLRVTLFWNRKTGDTFIRLEDLKQGRPAILSQCPPSQAWACFQHPYAMLSELR